jgi:tRNA(Ile2) C34 agmatinyltransferase TiaS
MRDFSQAEDRFLKAHRSDGITVVASVMGRDTADLVQRAGELGIEVSIVPEPGAVCPLCGGRMTRWGRGWKHGMCESCWNRRLSAARESLMRDLRSGREANSKRVELGRRRGSDLS